MSTTTRTGTETKNKKSKKGFLLKAVFLFALLYFIVIAVMSFFDAPFTSTTAQKGSLEERITCDGYIFRDQTVVTSPQDGLLECEVDEEERVAQGEQIASVYQAGVDSAVNEQLKKLNEEIEELEKDTLQQDVYANDTVRIEQQIAAEIQDIPEYGCQNNLEGADEKKDAINDLIDKKRTVTGEKESDDVILERLKSEKAQLENSNNLTRTYLTAPKPGVFSSRIDGMEDALSVSRLEECDVAYLTELDNMTVAYQESITAGGAACKIVNNSEWYFAAKIPQEEAERFSENESVGLRFFDITDTSVQGVVTDISAPSDGQAVLVIKSNDYVESVYSTSKANVEVIKNSYSGLKIPAQCIRVKENQNGVYVVRGDYAKFVTVDLLYSDNEWAIVRENSASGSSSLKLYDEVIMKAEKLEDGKKLR